MRSGKIMACLILMTAALLLAGPAEAEEESKPCPWEITQVGFGKWANGNHKAGTWYKGSFPINMPGVTERPDWYVNGSCVGKSQIHFSTRFIPNSSNRFNPGANTVKVQFQKPPYNGAYHQCTIEGFDWNDVPRGGYKYYPCR
jgi:hypothetical protein